MDILLSLLPWAMLAVGIFSLLAAIYPQLFPVPIDDFTPTGEEPGKGEMNYGTLQILFGRGSRVTNGVILTFVGLALFLDLSWMQWTSATAAFFFALGGLLLGMTIWDIYQPTGHPQGFLPIPFSRGERLFLSFMIFFGVLGLWIAFLPEVTLWGAIVLALVLIVVVTRFG